MKKTIHLNNSQIKELEELINLLGIKGYGEIPKALAFSVTFTLDRLKSDVFVLPEMNKDQIELWFSSVMKVKTLEIAQEKVDKLLDAAEK